MIERFHGIDRHKKYSTISVLDRSGQEVSFLKCYDLRGYVAKLGATDAVVLEASGGAFWWADRIEERGAQCHVLTPYRFRIIKDSWNKTDRQDARNMSKALWVYLVTGEFGIPTVYKPAPVIRELRRLFSGYELINRQATSVKNAIQAVLTEEGIVLERLVKRRLFGGSPGSRQILRHLQLSGASATMIELHLQLLAGQLEAKERLTQQILKVSEPLAQQIKLLMSIRGITALTAAAFLADVADVRRFKSQRKMSAYLGMVPRARDSGGMSRPGHINRASRKLARTLLTQSIFQVTRSSLQLRHQYEQLIQRRGVGRARIAMIRHLAGMMRQMLLSGQEFRWVERQLLEKKLKVYEKTLTAARKENQVA